MADFQKSVNLYNARGVPGAFASINPVVSTPLGYIAGEDGVTIGGFCWEDPENDGVVLSTGTGKPLGFVVRDIIYPIYDLGGAKNIAPEGFNVNVHVSGDFYVQVPAAVTKGQKVFVNPTTGALSGGTAGGTVASSVETDWFFATDAEKNGIAIISNHGNTPAVASGE